MPYGLDNFLLRDRSDKEIDDHRIAQSRQTQAYLDSMQQRLAMLPSGRPEDYAFVPGRGYVTRQEMNADYVLQDTPPPRSSLGPAIRGLEMMNAAFGVPEGLLAGLSSDTEESQGFYPEARKALMGLVDPAQGVDEATRDRLYRRRDGSPMGTPERLMASSLMFPGSFRMGARTFNPKAGIPTFLETPKGSYRLPNSRPAPRLALPLR